ncbi:MAG: transcription termination/antitermination protein NusG [Alphaproteobacteria bacterium]
MTGALDPSTFGRWYVVQTNVRAEKHARDRLLLDGFTVHWPHYAGTIRHARKVTEVMLPLFPRYIFVAVGPHRDLWQVEHTVGVSAVVHRGPAPLEIPPRVIAGELARCYGSGLVRGEELERLGLAPKSRPFRVGQTVRIADGPFAGLVAVVDRLDKRDALRVFVEMLGRETAVDTVDGGLAAVPG